MPKSESESRYQGKIVIIDLMNIPEGFDFEEKVNLIMDSGAKNIMIKRMVEYSHGKFRNEKFPLLEWAMDFADACRPFEYLSLDENLELIVLLISKGFVKRMDDAELQKLMEKATGNDTSYAADKDLSMHYNDVLHLLIDACTKKYESNKDSLKKVFDESKMHQDLIIPIFMQSKQDCAVNNVDLLTELYPNLIEKIDKYAAKLKEKGKISELVYNYIKSEKYTKKAKKFYDELEASRDLEDIEKWLEEGKGAEIEMANEQKNEPENEVLRILEEFFSAPSPESKVPEGILVDLSQAEEKEANKTGVINILDELVGLDFSASKNNNSESIENSKDSEITEDDFAEVDAIFNQLPKLIPPTTTRTPKEAKPAKKTPAIVPELA